ncbi:MAG: UDP-N-acetylmuramate--L-alanine ligase [Aquiluna sp.]|nr:UDP-N-acetylmuramate--L-alanine ligase [Aquiluna sp.]MCF8544962.1 UDP-N-acetylmuramate--L-alanine ligase [Aquiluna sp.]
MIKPDYSQSIPADLGAIHFIGIGGSGMSGIARLVLAMGHRVTGSDVRESPNIAQLRELGAEIFIGHDASNLGNPDTVVVTSALWPTNPEMLLALEKGIPVLHRSAVLAHLASKGKLIAVAGAHGKTTSTGMVVSALKRLGGDPSFVNGGVIQEYDASAGFGRGEHFVIEADESDSSFLHYKTEVTLITNVDPDHLDHFGSLEAFEGEFIKFANAAGSLVVISSDDPGAVRVTAGLEHPRIFTFGESPGATVRLVAIEAGGPRVKFELEYLGHRAELELAIAGKHNALNAAGAVAVLVGIGYDFESSCAAVQGFSGTVRRFELHGTKRGVRVYDDFAHHPTEVAAALSGARAVVGSGKLITVFQPHLYSRTRIFSEEFARALELSDEIVLLDIYGAREDPEPGVTKDLISEKFVDSSRMHPVENWDQACVEAASIAQDGDFIITMGCGDVYKMVPGLLSALEK